MFRRLLCRGLRQKHYTNAVPAVLLRCGRRHSAQRYQPDVVVIKLKTSMQVVAHENRATPGYRQLIAWSSRDGVTLDYDGSARYTISKLGDCCIDPHFPRTRKHFAFTLL